MPRQLRLKLTVITLSSLVLVCAGMAAFFRWDNKSIRPERNIAAKLEMHRMMGKHLAPITVQLPQPVAIPDNDSQELKLTGYITLNHDLGADLEYHWELPQGVSVVSGPVRETLAGIKPGETATVEIDLTGFSRESLKHIILHGQAVAGSDFVGHSALISSRPEDSWEFVAPEMREHAEQTRPGEFNNGRLVK